MIWLAFSLVGVVLFAFVWGVTVGLGIGKLAEFTAQRLGIWKKGHEITVYYYGGIAVSCSCGWKGRFGDEIEMTRLSIEISDHFKER